MLNERVLASPPEWRDALLLAASLVPYALAGAIMVGTGGVALGLGVGWSYLACAAVGLG